MRKLIIIFFLSLFTLPLQAQGIKAGIDLMIGADLHEFMLCEPGTMGNRFPILVNDNERRLQFECSRRGRIHVSTFNASGEKEFEREF
jgi:hypothetical protein